MTQKKKLSIIQQNALLPAREKAGLAQMGLKSLMIEVLKELGISEKEYSMWNFANDFSFIEKIEPKKKDGNE